MRCERPGRLVAAVVSVALLLVAGAAGAQDLPRPRGFINDFANVIPEEDETAMRGIVTALRDQTGAEIAVVTVDSMEPYATIEEYGIALAEQWEVGDRQEDNGVIFVVAVQERRVRIEVGFGLEGALPDGRAGALLDDYVIPYLRENQWGPGLLNGTAAIASVVADEYGVTLTNVEAEPRAPARSSGPDLGDLVYVIFVLLFFGGRWFFWPLLFAGRRRGFFGGGFGSGSSRGPSHFGGFGGGGFGGGGASRGF